MGKVSQYSISLDSQDPSDLVLIKKRLENNAYLFDDTILSIYGGDPRYSVISGSFSVTSITEDHFDYVSEVNYFSGCLGQNEEFSIEGKSDYCIEEGCIVFHLDETAWVCD